MHPVRSYQSIFFRAKVVTLVLPGSTPLSFIRRSIAASPSGIAIPFRARGEESGRQVARALGDHRGRRRMIALQLVPTATNSRSGPIVNASPAVS